MKVKLSIYAKLNGISLRTAWRRINDGTIKIERSNTNRIFVELNDNKNEYVVTYARVSSSENKSNLDKQSQRLIDFCAAKGWIVREEIKEIGSGLNDERKKLQNLFLNKKITKVVIEHKDRLTRFGFNYLKKLWDVEIVVMNYQRTKDSLVSESKLTHLFNRFKACA